METHVGPSMFLFVYRYWFMILKSLCLDCTTPFGLYKSFLKTQNNISPNIHEALKVRGFRTIIDLTSDGCNEGRGLGVFLLICFQHLLKSRVRGKELTSLLYM